MATYCEHLTRLDDQHELGFDDRRDYRAEWPRLGFEAHRVGLHGITALDGRVIRAGELDVPWTTDGSHDRAEATTLISTGSPARPALEKQKAHCVATLVYDGFVAKIQ